MAVYRPRVNLWYRNSFSNLQDMRNRDLYFLAYWLSSADINMSVSEPCHVFFLVIIPSFVITRHYILP